MSYEILYRRQFIKVDDERVIPLLETGSNNCFMQGKSGRYDKRERGWHVMSYYAKGAFIVKNDELLAAIDAERANRMERYKDETNPSYSDKSWGYWTSIALAGKGTRGTSFGSHRNYFKLGIAEAKTIEELKAIGVTISMRPAYYGDKTNPTPEVKPTVYFESTEHMLAKIKEYEEFYANTGVNLYFDLSGEWGLEQQAIIRKQQKRRERNATKVELKDFWILKMKELGGYFHRATARGYRYAHYISQAKKFKTEAAANTYWKQSPYKDKMEPMEYHSEIPLTV